MHKTLVVAWREFKATAMTKAFIFGAVMVPVLMIGLAALGPVLFNPTPPPLTGTVAIVDPGGKLTEAAKIEFQPENIRKRIERSFREQAEQVGDMSSLSEKAGARGEGLSSIVRPFDLALSLDSSLGPADLESLKFKLREGGLVAIVTTFEGPAEGSQTDGAKATPARLYVPSNMNPKHTGLIEDLVQASIGRAKIAEAGLEVETVRSLARPPNPTTIRISREGEEKPENTGAKVFKMIVPMAFMMLIWIGAFVSANYLLTTTIEEKSNKVMEVLLSAVSPMQLMGGKIIGQAMVGMVMVGMYLALGLAALTGLALMDLIEWVDLVYFAVFYVMAYFMIASIMAAIGSAVNELREAQSLMTPAMVLLMIPLMLWLPISDSPNGMLATVTSFIPPLIPFVMVLRLTGGEPIATWQIVASILVGYASMLGMIWMAAKIFRVGVLMYGKPPSPVELLRWLRYR
ncbi:MAG: ABC transporter permease [Phycisphaerales bacterium]|nr:ABC transporter permease [Phycisphaerales bacterium]MCI0674611.1 ABC transporter permease [Phycisphaerales bacterium]